MNIILGLGIGVIGVLVLMGHITLERKLNSLDKKMDKQKDYWKSVEYSIEIKNNRTSKEIQEGNNFLIDSIGTLAENIKIVDIGVNKIRERDFTLGQNIGELTNNTNILKDAISECMLCLEKQIDASKTELKNTLEQNKEDINRNTNKQVSRIIYTVPMVKVMD